MKHFKLRIIKVFVLLALAYPNFFHAGVAMESAIYRRMRSVKSISDEAMNITAKVQETLESAVSRLEAVIKVINPDSEVVEIKITPSSYTRGLMIKNSDFDNLAVYIRGIKEDDLKDLNSLFIRWLKIPGLRLFDDYENPPLLIPIEDIRNQEIKYGIDDIPMVTVYEGVKFKSPIEVAEETNVLVPMLFDKHVARIKLFLSRGEIDANFVRTLLKHIDPESYYYKDLMKTLDDFENLKLSENSLRLVTTLDELFLKDDWTYIVPSGEEDAVEQALIELYEKGLVHFYDGKLIIHWRTMGARWADRVWNRWQFVIYKKDSSKDDGLINMLPAIEKELSSKEPLIAESELLESMKAPNPVIAEKAIRQSIEQGDIPEDMIQDYIYNYIYNLGNRGIFVNGAAIEAIQSRGDLFEARLKEYLAEIISSGNVGDYFSSNRRRALFLINILFNMAIIQPEKTDEIVEFMFENILAGDVGPVGGVPNRVIQEVLKNLGTVYVNISNPRLRETVDQFFNESALSHIVRTNKIAKDILKNINSMEKGSVEVLEDSEGNLILEATAPEQISYKNYFIKGVFETNNTLLASLIEGRGVTVIVDESIYDVYEDKIKEYLDANNIKDYSLYRGRASEYNKNLSSVFEIIDNAIKDKRDRKAIFVVVGGGTLMDVVGLAAQLYRRKVDYIRVPTTLLGIIDAAIGVKVGVNYQHHKNLIGAFYPPYAVISDVSFLKTLDTRQLRSGMGEMLKMAILSDRELFEDIEKYGRKIIENEPFEEKEDIIRRAAVGELRYIQRDFYERDLRREVDFGHTFAHYIEEASGYALLHGEAVVIDILITSHIAMQRGILKPEEFQRIVKVVQYLGFPLFHESLTLGNMLEAVQKAKAHKGGKLIMVIPEYIGKVIFTDVVSEKEIDDALKYLLAISK